MLPEEQAENSRYFYELASARFGWSWDVLTKVQAFHFKLGQGAKTGTGGHLPGHKVRGRIAEVRGLPEGTPAVSPPTFPDWHGVDDFRRFADEVRERSGGIPIGVKLSAQHIEDDIDAALDDRRRLRDPRRPRRRHRRRAAVCSATTSRCRRSPRSPGPAGTSTAAAARDVTLVVTGGLRDAADFAKALALGADAVAIANSRDPGDRLPRHARLPHRTTARSASPPRSRTCGPGCRSTRPPQRLDRFLRATVELMQVLARACGHDSPVATSTSTTSPRSTATWPRSPASPTAG